MKALFITWTHFKTTFIAYQGLSSSRHWRTQHSVSLRICKQSLCVLVTCSSSLTMKVIYKFNITLNCYLFVTKTSAHILRTSQSSSAAILPTYICSQGSSFEMRARNSTANILLSPFLISFLVFYYYSNNNYYTSFFLEWIRQIIIFRVSVKFCFNNSKCLFISCEKLASAADIRTPEGKISRTRARVPLARSKKGLTLKKTNGHRGLVWK